VILLRAFVWRGDRRGPRQSALAGAAARSIRLHPIRHVDRQCHLGRRHSSAPEVIHLSPAELEGLVAELRVHLPAPVFELVYTALQTLQWVPEAMELKTTTIARLKRVLFGSRSEKTAALFPPPPATPAEATEANPNKGQPHARFICRFLSRTDFLNYLIMADGARRREAGAELRFYSMSNPSGLPPLIRIIGAKERWRNA